MFLKISFLFFFTKIENDATENDADLERTTVCELLSIEQ